MMQCQCPLCDREGAEGQPSRGFVAYFKCPRCGEFSTNSNLDARLPSMENRHLLSGVTRNASDRGDRLDLTTENAEQLISSAPNAGDVANKVRILLRYLSCQSKSPGRLVGIDTDIDYPVCYASDGEELYFLLNSLSQFRWIQDLTPALGPQWLTVSAAGWEEADRAPSFLSDKAFIAMSFDDSLNALWLEAMIPAVDAAGYLPRRVDKVEHNDRIDDRIMAEIRESRFLVADFTGHRHGVYFEAGFALGLGLPVIWTCREDDLKGSHFDTRQYNHITWQTTSELKEKLEFRIRATIGRGPLKPEEQK
jgi:nucleoside 2-deoxyribosyltransferase